MFYHKSVNLPYSRGVAVLAFGNKNTEESFCGTLKARLFATIYLFALKMPQDPFLFKSDLVSSLGGIFSPQSASPP